MECQLRVLSRTMQTAIFCNHSFGVDSGKPSVVGIFLLPVPWAAILSLAIELLCGTDHPRCDNACKHSCFQTNEAAVHVCGVLCVDVCRCEVCKILLSCHINSDGAHFSSKKGPNIEDVEDGFGFGLQPFLHTTLPRKRNFRCAEHREKGGPKRKRARATVPPCTETRTLKSQDNCDQFTNATLHKPQLKSMKEQTHHIDESSKQQSWKFVLEKSNAAVSVQTP